MNIDKFPLLCLRRSRLIKYYIFSRCSFITVQVSFIAAPNTHRSRTRKLKFHFSECAKNENFGLGPEWSTLRSQTITDKHHSPEQVSLDLRMPTRERDGLITVQFIETYRYTRQVWQLLPGQTAGLVHLRRHLHFLSRRSFLCQALEEALEELVTDTYSSRNILIGDQCGRSSLPG